MDTPREEHSFLSQKEPQPEGRRILMDSGVLLRSSSFEGQVVANTVTAHQGAAPGICS